jgi:predicted AAA+ superfamily ATPase
VADYRNRIIEEELARLMRVMGAVAIDGPKAVGKTRTASQYARTVLRVDVDAATRAALESYPDQLFENPTPILFDEWQEAPELWNLVRRAVDDRDERGLYLLTGSARPRDDARMHSGAGRIGRLRMRTMTLLESGHSTGAVSLAQLIDGGALGPARPASLTVPHVLERMVVGGWPDTLALDERDARIWLDGYLTNIIDVDVPALGPRRDPARIGRLLTALGRAVGTPLNRSALAADIGGDRGPAAIETVTHYLDALERLMVIEPLPAWRPHMRSRTQLRASAVHHFVDPALGLSALKVGTRELLSDLNAAGFHFESLVLRDLRVYAQSLGGSLSSWRDTKSGREVDAILELPDGRWAAFEFKLGESAADSAAEALISFAHRVDVDRHGSPAALVVVTAGRYTLRRPDGVVVVPISVLGP